MADGSTLTGGTGGDAWVKKPLKVGATLTVTVTRVGMVGQRKVLRILRKMGPKVSVSCLAVGTSKPTSCLA